MPILREYYLRHMQQVQEIRNAPAPNYLDLNVSDKTLQEHLYRLRGASLVVDALDSRIGMALKSLSDERLTALFNKLKAPNGSKYATEKSFLQDIRKDSPSANLEPEYFGRSLEEILDAYEEAIGPEKVQELIAMPLPQPMTDPYSVKDRVYRPYEREIEDLRNTYTNTGNSAENEENRLLLEEVGKALEDVKPELLEKINETHKGTKTGTGFPSDDKMQGDRAQLRREQGFQKLADGKYKDLISHGYYQSGAPDYEVLTDNFTRELTAEDNQALDALSKNGDEGLSQDAKDVLESIAQGFDQLDYSDSETLMLTNQAFPARRPEQPGEIQFNTEHKVKYYAFYPLSLAKSRLTNAVLSGDMKQIRQAMEEYRRIDGVTDGMMKTLRSDKVSDEPVYSANVESTRSATRKLPEKYALDFSRQNKLNSLAVSYFSLKNAKLSMKELMDDPIGTARKMGERYLEGCGLDANPNSIGTTLQIGMKPVSSYAPADAIMAEWSRQVNGLGRGLAGIAGVEKDPERRAKFLAQVQIGFMQATQKIREESRLYETMQRLASGKKPGDKELRNLLYQHAAVLPETGPKRFNQRSLIDEFSKGRRPNALDGLDAANETVNYRELAKRNEKVLREAAQAEQATGTFKNQFDPDLYLLNAFSVQSKLLQRAGAVEQQDPGFQEFRESLKNIWQLARKPNTRAILKLAADTLENPNAYDFLRTDKHDQISSSNSPEYNRMLESLNKVRGVYQTVRQDDAKKLHALYGSDFAKDLTQAKEDAFNYVRLKRKNGHKTTFHYTSGERRANEGLAAYKKLGELQDALGLRSPAQKLYDEARLALLMNRHSDRWLSTQGLQVMSRMIYAKSILEAGLPENVQRQLLQPQSLNARLQRHTQQLGRRFLADQITLADEAMEEKGEFRTATKRLGSELRQNYDRQNAPAVLKKAQEDLRLGYALDEAAKEYGIPKGATTQDCNLRNEKLMEIAREIMKRPAFNEIMDRLIAGKTAEELKALHAPANFDRIEKKVSETYNRVANTIAYEKRCANIVAESVLQSKGIQKPDAETLANNAQALRKNAQFQAYIREKTKNMDSDQISDATNALAVAEHRNQLRDEICDRLNQPLREIGIPGENVINLQAGIHVDKKGKQEGELLMKDH